MSANLEMPGAGCKREQIKRSKREGGPSDDDGDRLADEVPDPASTVKKQKRVKVCRKCKANSQDDTSLRFVDLDKCEMCWDVKQAFPELSWDECCEKAETDELFAKDWSKAEKIQQGGERTWRNESLVGFVQQAGMKVETLYWFLTLSDFADMFHITPAQSGFQTMDIPSEDGRGKITGVLVKPSPEDPPHLYRRVSMFSQAFFKVNENVVGPGQQYREAQCHETYKCLIRENADSYRDTDFRPERRQVVKTLKEIAPIADKAKRDLEAQVIQVPGGVADSDDEVLPVGGSLLSRTARNAAVASTQAPAAKAQGRGRGGGQAAAKRAAIMAQMRQDLLIDPAGTGKRPSGRARGSAASAAVDVQVDLSGEEMRSKGPTRRDKTPDEKDSMNLDIDAHSIMEGRWPNVKIQIAGMRKTLNSSGMSQHSRKFLDLTRDVRVWENANNLRLSVAEPTVAEYHGAKTKIEALIDDFQEIPDMIWRRWTAMEAMVRLSAGKEDFRATSMYSALLGAIRAFDDAFQNVGEVHSETCIEKLAVFRNILRVKIEEAQNIAGGLREGGAWKSDAPAGPLEAVVKHADQAGGLLKGPGTKIQKVKEGLASAVEAFRGELAKFPYICEHPEVVAANNAAFDAADEAVALSQATTLEGQLCRSLLKKDEAARTESIIPYMAQYSHVPQKDIHPALWEAAAKAQAAKSEVKAKGPPAAKAKPPGGKK
ncbi:unnamed protein product [Prorocentrum cordatum]|uniref:Uncharacterized protein n=1 Tax=Prorocentrum cordatum TaxID=2364126 RepID=A0ABN9UPF2_9DINO|nr:unnamed protein product [Polarella glacialis]